MSFFLSNNSKLGQCLFISRNEKLTNLIRLASSATHTVNSQSSEDSAEKIEIPAYVPRSNIDILMALHSTIGHDSTSQSYKFHDDTYLRPQTAREKQIYSVSKEAGRFAAKWVRDEKPHLFNHRDAMPFSQEFLPNLNFDEHPTVEALVNLISLKYVTKSYEAYNKLLTMGTCVPDEVVSSLLALLCYYNSQDCLETDRIEEIFYTRHLLEKTDTRCTWSNTGLANCLFDSIENKQACHYDSIVCGMAKYNQKSKALEYWNEMREKRLLPSVSTYNAIIALISMDTATKKDLETKCKEILTEMATNKVWPNASTLNALLLSAQNIRSFDMRFQFALDAWREMKEARVRPSLGNYSLLLDIFRRTKSSTDPRLLVEILHEIRAYYCDPQSSRTLLQTHHPIDSRFFVNSMNYCRTHLMNPKLALDLHAVLTTQSSISSRLLGPAQHEYAYYRHFLLLLLDTSSICEFVENYYLRIVPSLYIPSVTVLQLIIEKICEAGEMNLMGRIWRDVVIFRLHNNEQIVCSTLRCLWQNTQPLTATADVTQSGPDTECTASDICRQIFELCTSEAVMGRYVLAAQSWSQLLQVLSSRQRVTLAARVFRWCSSNADKLIGSLDQTCMLSFVRLCAQHGQLDTLVDCLDYATENGHQMGKFVEMFERHKLLSAEKIDEIKTRYCV